MNGMNNLFTHQQFLIAELRRLDYSRERVCLEFGAGDGSANIFRGFLIDNPNLTVYSFDNSADWYDQIRRDYDHTNYLFYLVESWEAVLGDLESRDGIYDIVFIDQSPFDARIETIDRLKNKTKVFVLHDFDYFNKGIVNDILCVCNDSFFAQYKEDFILEPCIEILPPTLIMRNRNL